MHNSSWRSYPGHPRLTPEADSPIEKTVDARRQDLDAPWHWPRRERIKRRLKRSDFIQRGHRHRVPRNSSAARCTPGRWAVALRHRHQQIAALRQRKADRGMLRAIGHVEIVAARPSRHVGEPDHLARPRAARNCVAHQVEIGDAVDLVVIGNAAVAIAEADLRPHIELDSGAAARRRRSGTRGPRASRRAETARRSRASDVAMLPPRLHHADRRQRRTSAPNATALRSG